MTVTVEQLIAVLKPRQDARVHFWEKMQAKINGRAYEEVLRMLLRNVDDCDFDEQVRIVAKSIAQWTKERENDPTSHSCDSSYVLL